MKLLSLIMYDMESMFLIIALGKEIPAQDDMFVSIAFLGVQFAIACAIVTSILHSFDALSNTPKNGGC